MQDGEAIPADEAGQWLREHFEGVPPSQVEITWTVQQEPNPAALTRVLDILFAPHPGNEAA